MKTNNNKPKAVYQLTQPELRSRFISLLRQNAVTRRPFQVFSDYCEMMAIAFSNAVDKVQYETREARYLQTQGKYSKEEVSRFAEMTAALACLCEKRFYDHLGSIFMELNFGNDAKGQFFTPYEISGLMAGITLDNPQAVIEQEGFMSVDEPACGAGGMVIAVAEHLCKLDLDYQNRLHVTARDVDAQAVHMAYIQMTLYHIPGVVFHGNTLTRETWGNWVTPAHVLGLWDFRLHRKFKKTDELEENHEPLGLPSAVASNVDSKPQEEAVQADTMGEALRVLVVERVGQLDLF